MFVKGQGQIIEPFTSCRGHPALCELPSKVSGRGWHPLPSPRSPRAFYKNPSHPDYILKPRSASHRDIHTTRLDLFEYSPGPNNFPRCLGLPLSLRKLARESCFVSLLCLMGNGPCIGCMHALHKQLAPGPIRFVTGHPVNKCSAIHGPSK